MHDTERGGAPVAADGDARPLPGLDRRVLGVLVQFAIGLAVVLALRPVRRWLEALFRGWLGW